MDDWEEIESFQNALISSTEHKHEGNTLVFSPIINKLSSKLHDFFYVHKRPISLKYCL